MKTFYEWIVEHKEEKDGLGQLARDMLWLSERFPIIRKIDSFYDLVSLASNSLIHRRRWCSGDLTRDGFFAVSDALWIEYCDSINRPIKDEGRHVIPEYPEIPGESAVPYWLRTME